LALVLSRQSHYRVYTSSPLSFLSISKYIYLSARDLSDLSKQWGLSLLEGEKKDQKNTEARSSLVKTPKCEAKMLETPIGGPLVHLD
jgi:hypothetical protein